MKSTYQVLIQYALIFLLLAATSILAVMMVAFRSMHFHTVFYGFLIWNLILAWTPIFPAIVLAKKRVQGIAGFLIASIIFLIWLVLFPNSTYIVTDIIYLKDLPWVPFWFDIVMFIIFIWNGLFLGFFSLLLVHRFLEQLLKGKFIPWLIVIFVIFLSSFGIYLGRFKRWNTWDIIKRPSELSSDMLEPFINPIQHVSTFGFIILYGVFLLIIYASLKLVYDAGGTESLEPAA